MNQRFTMAVTVAVIATAQLCGQSIHISNRDKTPPKDAEVQPILISGATKLTIEPGDRQCSLQIQATPLLSIPRALTSVETQRDYERVCDRANLKGMYFHVVKRITWCPGSDQNGTIYGCSDQPGDCSVVVWIKNGGDLAVSQWMHELGHTKGLEHRGGAGILMNPELSNDQFGVSDRECKKFRKVTTDSLDKPASPKIQENALSLPVDQFVRRVYLHGIPIAEARKYSAKDVDDLLEALTNHCAKVQLALCKEEQAWPNVISMVGLVGTTSQKNADLLVQFVSDVPAVTGWGLQAKLSVPSAIGSLIFRSKNSTLNRTLIAYLTKGGAPDTWKDIKLLVDDEIGSDAEELAKESILGLGISGNADANKILSDWRGSDQRFLKDEAVRQLIERAFNLNSKLLNSIENR